MHNPNPPKYDVEELLAMDDPHFRSVVTENLHATTQFKGAFQNESVIERTLLGLVDHLWVVDSMIERNAEDPTVPAEKYAASLKFRRHLLSAIDITERRVGFMFGRASREASAWKQLLHDVCDELEGGPDDDILDEFLIPFPSLPGDKQPDMTLRSWLEVRRIKDPSRVKGQELLAA